MKTLMTLALAGLISFSSLANDNNEDLMELSSVKARYKTVNVLLKDGVGKAKIAIMDESGKRLHQKKVKQIDGDLLIPYNMESLPSGEYQVEISTDSERVLYTVMTFNRSIPVEQLPLMAYGKKVDDNTINLSVIGLTEPGVDVKIRHEGSDRLIHSETINTPEGFKKDFSFKGYDLEDIYFELKDNLGRKKIIHI